MFLQERFTYEVYVQICNEKPVPFCCMTGYCAFGSPQNATPSILVRPDRQGGCPYSFLAETGKLVMHVRTLRGIVVRAGRLFHDFDVKTYRQSLRGEALGVVAGLVAEHSMHHVFSRLHSV